ncbi:MAG: hypothetical protein RR623_09015, partial [Bacilli bacterium]
IYDLKCDDEYYFVDCYGSVERREFSNDYYDNVFLSTGNIFLTEYEAIIALEKLKVEAILRKRSYNFSEEEWKDGLIDKYYIEYSEYDNEVRRPCTRFSKKQGTMYFKTKEDCKNAIDEIGEQRLINYFEGVI